MSTKTLRTYGHPAGRVSASGAVQRSGRVDPALVARRTSLEHELPGSIEENSEHERPRAVDAESGTSRAPMVTQLLEAAGNGDCVASEALLPLVYEELRRVAASQLAREPAGLTLQPTALVHEAYLKLVGKHEVQWQGRAHFFGAAARAMRQILVDRARRAGSEKHGGGRARRELGEATLAIVDPTPTPGSSGGVDLLRLNAALESLELRDSRQAEVVLLRYFAGLSIEQTAESLGVSPATVKTDWTFAKAWLRREMDRSSEADGPH